MCVKTDKKLLDEAMNSGCKTAAQLALYVKRRNSMQAESKNIEFHNSNIS